MLSLKALLEALGCGLAKGGATLMSALIELDENIAVDAEKVLRCGVGEGVSSGITPVESTSALLRDGLKIDEDTVMEMVRCGVGEGVGSGTTPVESTSALLRDGLKIDEDTVMEMVGCGVGEGVCSGATLVVNTSALLGGKLNMVENAVIKSELEVSTSTAGMEDIVNKLTSVEENTGIIEVVGAARNRSTVND